MQPGTCTLGRVDGKGKERTSARIWERTFPPSTPLATTATKVVANRAAPRVVPRGGVAFVLSAATPSNGVLGILILRRRPAGKAPTLSKNMFLLGSTKFRKHIWDALSTPCRPEG